MTYFYHCPVFIDILDYNTDICTEITYLNIHKIRLGFVRSYLLTKIILYICHAF